MGLFTVGDILSAGNTHVGLARELNEDSFLDRSEAGLWAVADGMGGLSRGERASGLITERLAELDLPEDLEVCINLVANTLESVNAELRADTSSKLSGSTVVVLMLREHRFACLWAGDSRLYRHSRSGLERLSKDHSIVEQLIDAGAITAEQARHHPMSNRITRAIGTEAQLELDVLRGKLRAGDRFLLCTDGLHSMVEASEIETITKADEASPAVEQLIKAALAGGGRDNVSVVLVDVAADADLDTTLVGH